MFRCFVYGLAWSIVLDFVTVIQVQNYAMAAIASIYDWKPLGALINQIDRKHFGTKTMPPSTREQNRETPSYLVTTKDAYCVR